MAPSATRRCVGCGATNVAFKLDNRFFCEACGHDASVVDGRSTDNEAAVSVSVRGEPGSTGNAEQRGRSQTPTSQTPMFKAWSNRARKGRGWIAIVVLCLGAAGVVVWQRSHRSNVSSERDRATHADPEAAHSKLDERGQSRSQESVPRVSQFITPRVSAASTLAAGNGYSYEASNLVDGDLTTSWQPARRQPSTLRFDFTQPVTITAMRIANGFQRMDTDGDQFLNNGRVVEAIVRFSDNSEQAIHLDPKQRDIVRIDINRKTTTTVTLVVKKMIKGTKYPDLAISEIAFEVHASTPRRDSDDKSRGAKVSQECQDNPLAKHCL